MSLQGEGPKLEVYPYYPGMQDGSLQVKLVGLLLESVVQYDGYYRGLVEFTVFGGKSPGQVVLEVYPRLRAPVYLGVLAALLQEEVMNKIILPVGEPLRTVFCNRVIPITDAQAQHLLTELTRAVNHTDTATG
jgi:hypothetical protein